MLYGLLLRFFARVSVCACVFENVCVLSMMFLCGVACYVFVSLCVCVFCMRTAV